MNKIILLLDDSVEITSTEYLSNLISMCIYNFTKNVEGIMYLYKNPNSYRDVAHIQQLEIEKDESAPQMVQGTQVGQQNAGVRIIGIKGATKEAGATTLTYLMKQELEDNYSVAAIEVDKRDFMFFNSKNLITTTSTEIGNVIAKNSDFEVLLVDVNGSKSAETLCHIVLYLLEPSIIKINRMMLISSKSLKDLEGKRVVLNRSMLSSSDVSDFEYESKLKILYNMPPLNDREKNIDKVNELLIRLGFDRQQVIQ
jgi:hypothetical protein